MTPLSVGPASPNKQLSQLVFGLSGFNNDTEVLQSCYELNHMRDTGFDHIPLGAHQAVTTKRWNHQSPWGKLGHGKSKNTKQSNQSTENLSIKKKNVKNILGVTFDSEVW